MNRTVRYTCYALLLFLVGLWANLLGLRQQNGFVQFMSRIHQINKKSVLKANPFRSLDAHVRVGNELCSQEKEFIKRRLPQVTRALQDVTGLSLSHTQVPKISLIASGGGLRAMLFSTGVIAELQQSGLFDALTHISTLSGSTWAASLLYTHDLSIKAWKELVIQKSLKTRTPQGEEYSLIFEALHAKRLFDKQVSIVDFYGSLIANSFLDDFGEQRHKQYLSNQAEKISEGQLPLPIYTAITLDTHGKYRWMEFSPYEVGSAWLSAYIPTWAYGRNFAQGVSINRAPEHALGFLLGLYGAAFGAPIEKLYHEGIKQTASPTLQKIFEQYVIKWFGDKRLMSGCAHNFTYGMASTPLGKEAFLKIIDAGIDFNLPFAPVSGERSERASDILIFADASQELDNGWHLKHAEQYAKEHNLKFPPIQCQGIDSRAVSVFKDEQDASCPIVIYISRLYDKTNWEYVKQDPNFCSYAQYFDHIEHEVVPQPTTATTYSEFDARQLVALGEINLRAAVPVILDAIRTKIAEQ